MCFVLFCFFFFSPLLLDTASIAFLDFFQFVSLCSKAHALTGHICTNVIVMLHRRLLQLMQENVISCLTYLIAVLTFSDMATWKEL